MSRRSRALAGVCFGRWTRRLSAVLARAVGTSTFAFVWASCFTARIDSQPGFECPLGDADMPHVVKPELVPMAALPKGYARGTGPSTHRDGGSCVGT
jgi:hypothetical protein